MTTERVLLKNRYEIHSVLGEGAFGTTFQGFDTTTLVQIAVKTISFQQIQEWKALEFFERESIVLKALSHPGIPKYIDSFFEDTETDRVFYLVRELAVGESLSNLAKNGWRATEQEVKHIVEQILEIIIYLHELEPPVIHRDIKPSNIIYQPDTGKVFLIDFGAVQDTFGNGVGTFAGTYGYIAPEQLRGETSQQSDIYSVAMTLAFLLTQREPSELPHKRMKIDLRSAKVSASDELLKWLEKASEPIPDDRFLSARDAIFDLRRGVRKEIKLPKGSKIGFDRQNDDIRITIPLTMESLEPLLDSTVKYRLLLLWYSLIVQTLNFLLSIFFLSASWILYPLVFIITIFSVSFITVILGTLQIDFVIFVILFIVALGLSIFVSIKCVQLLPKSFRKIWKLKNNILSGVLVGLEFNKDKIKISAKFNLIPGISFNFFKLPVSQVICQSCKHFEDKRIFRVTIFDLINQKELIDVYDTQLVPCELKWLHSQVNSYLLRNLQNEIMFLEDNYD